MILKPHYLSVLVQTLKLFAALLVCFAIALISTPSKMYTFYNGIKLLIPIFVIIYAYLFFFWRGAEIEFNEKSIIFNSKSGRKNHVEIAVKDIKNIEIYQRNLDKIFGLSRLRLDVEGMNHQTGSDLAVIENYLVFSNSQCQNAVNLLKTLTEGK